MNPAGSMRWCGLQFCCFTKICDIEAKHIEHYFKFRIRWREDLEDVQFFECDESERAGNKSFADSMLKEYEKERLAVLRSRQLGDDVMVEMVCSIISIYICIYYF